MLAAPGMAKPDHLDAPLGEKDGEAAPVHNYVASGRAKEFGRGAGAAGRE